MRILFIADIVPYPPNTGIKIRTYNLARELAKNGHQVHLVCFNHSNLLKTPEALDQAIESLLEFCHAVDAFPIPNEKTAIGKNWKRFRNLFESLPYRVSRYFSKDAAQAISNIVTQWKPDLIHLDKTELHIYASKYPNIPAIPTNHNVESQLFARRAAYEPSWLRRRFAKIQVRKTLSYEKEVLTTVPLFVTCTEIDLDTFRQVHNVVTPAIIVDNGVDISHYIAQIGQRENFLLLIGAQSRDATANFDATVYFMHDIWPLIRRACPQLRIKIVGRDPDPEILSLGHCRPGGRCRRVRRRRKRISWESRRPRGAASRGWGQPAQNSDRIRRRHPGRVNSNRGGRYSLRKW